MTVCMFCIICCWLFVCFVSYVAGCLYVLYHMLLVVCMPFVHKIRGWFHHSLNKQAQLWLVGDVMMTYLRWSF